MDIIRVVCRPIAVLAVGASLLLAGCTSTSQSELEKAKAAGAAEQAAKQSASAQQEAQQKLAAEVQKLKDQLAAKKSTTTPSPASPAQPAQPAQPVEPAGTSCGSNVSAGPNTTCPFALNVAYEYLAQGGGTRTISALSPVTNQYYTMNCVSGVPSVCRGGNNAVVYIR
jgi:hypothetical protein